MLLICLSAVALADGRFAENEEQILHGLTSEPVRNESLLFRAKGGTQSGPTASVNLRIKFDHGSARLKSESAGLLDDLAKALQHSRIRERQVTLIGHTDSSGTEEYNLALSKQRAQAVKDHLVHVIGILPERLLLSGLGESSPLNDNATQIQREVNRRVEISLHP